jgi:isocitrate dehydrogenase kinase/phosphatase
MKNRGFTLESTKEGAVRLIELLDQRNHYYEKFLSLSDRQVELLSLGQYQELDDFYEQREKILEIIRYIDNQIGEATAQISEVHPQDRIAVKERLAIKDNYVARIVDEDLKILGFIEEAKNLIIQELHQITKYRKVVKGYRSQSPGGKSVDEVA